MLYRFGFFILFIAFILAGCKDNESVVSPVNNISKKSVVDEKGQVDPEFKQLLEAEIMKEDNSLSKTTFDNWFINNISGPTLITSPGIYRLVNDFTVSLPDSLGIVIRSNFVLLLLDGHRITGPGNKSGAAVVLDTAQFVLVHGGRINTFGRGVALIETKFSAILGVNVEGGDEFANPPADPAQVGILLVNSNTNFIIANKLSLVNLGIFVTGPGSYNNKILFNNALGGANGLLGMCFNPHPNPTITGGPTHNLGSHNKLIRFGIGIQTKEVAALNLFNYNTIHYFNMAWEDLNGTNMFQNNYTMQIAPELVQY